MLEPRTQATTPSIAEADLALRQLGAIAADMANRDRYYKLGVCVELRKALTAEIPLNGRDEIKEKYRLLLLSL